MDRTFRRVLNTLPRATPVLRGESARRFLEKMANAKPETAKLAPTPRIREVERFIVEHGETWDALANTPPNWPYI